ncbi:hydroxymethylglutaryl-CoA reductase [Marinilabilia rubra]|uniref:Hydroxymethylglutaryl-CoA reductase n=1 Tax=Marinilabilia rubra TaxID=2162893 RepID=A0A2U2B5C5_9BACT|nr:hydroxymethylglutaryl-CoA reductase [Marinilabilia rubra]PWD98279.1 hydroxymethylglutaryl-CoA reductase [Marinilabilia rubra]
MGSIIMGFSRMSRQEKIETLIEYYKLPEDFANRLADFRHPEKQELFDDFSENTLSNFYLPFGVAPNFLVDDQTYVVPMVVEESSVVAAASRAASFWAANGGFKTTIHNTLKKGQIWFEWKGPASFLDPLPKSMFEYLSEALYPVTRKMEKRGGGIIEMEVIELDGKPGIFQLEVGFETIESMGANFINSCLEEMKEPLKNYFRAHAELKQYGEPDIIMAILSNYTTKCLVTSRVECPVDSLKAYSANLSPAEFARKFKRAVDIALGDTSRAVTHNKGIFNGIDSVVIATGNDFRAAEAAGHAWAAKDGKYRSLSKCEITPDGLFRMELTTPLALGTVGGLTRLHPMAALAQEMLGNPEATELMGIAAAAGLANNFSAVASLVTTGIQKGHMKLHLSNLLKAMSATPEEQKKCMEYFSDKTVSARAVEEYLQTLRAK